MQKSCTLLISINASSFTLKIAKAIPLDCCCLGFQPVLVHFLCYKSMFVHWFGVCVCCVCVQWISTVWFEFNLFSWLSHWWATLFCWCGCSMVIAAICCTMCIIFNRFTLNAMVQRVVHQLKWSAIETVMRPMKKFNGSDLSAFWVQVHSVLRFNVRWLVPTVIVASSII